MSLCETCPTPGRNCCTLLHIADGEFPQGDTIEQAEKYIDDYNSAVGKQFAFDGFATSGGRVPFKPLFKSQENGWYCWCLRLDRAGRCTDYANRPRACRDFRVGVDHNCALTPFNLENK